MEINFCLFIFLILTYQEHATIFLIIASSKAYFLIENVYCISHPA